MIKDMATNKYILLNNDIENISDNYFDDYFLNN